MAKDPGYVYSLTNPSFREAWVKIGKSFRPADIRSKKRDNTAVPECAQRSSGSRIITTIRRKKNSLHSRLSFSNANSG